MDGKWQALQVKCCTTNGVEVGTGTGKAQAIWWIASVGVPAGWVLLRGPSSPLQTDALAQNHWSGQPLGGPKGSEAQHRRSTVWWYTGNRELGGDGTSCEQAACRSLGTSRRQQFSAREWRASSVYWKASHRYLR